MIDKEEEAIQIIVLSSLPKARQVSEVKKHWMFAFSLSVPKAGSSESMFILLLWCGACA